MSNNRLDIGTFRPNEYKFLCPPSTPSGLDGQITNLLVGDSKHRHYTSPWCCMQERGNTAHVPEWRECTPCVPQSEREGSQRTCPNTREGGREHNAHAHVFEPAAAPPWRTTAGGARAPSAARACPRVRAHGEHHLLQHTKTR